MQNICKTFPGIYPLFPRSRILGSRHDTLEDHFQWANFEKILLLGFSLHRKIKRALTGYTFHARLWLEFSSDVPKADIEKWTTEIEKWERDTSLPDPYYVVPTGPTEVQVRAQLAEKEDAEAADGNISLHCVTPSGLVSELLEIEELQRRFLLKYPVVTRETSNLIIDIADRCSAIRRRMQAVREIQAVYMPCVPLLIAQQSRSAPSDQAQDRVDIDSRPERQQLFLPYQLSVEDLDGCVQGLADIESRLREGQMRSALDSLRVQLHIRSRMLTFKAKNSRHQRENQRSREKIDACTSKIKQFVAKYRAAREAKLALCGPGDWETEWRMLRDRDVRGLSEMELQVNDANEPLSRRRQVTEGQRVLSWIWLTADWDKDSGVTSIEGMHEALRVEWLRARARALRYKEEIVYLKEEQRRTLVSLEHTATIWEARAMKSQDTVADNPPLLAGLIAYANKQVSFHRALAHSFSLQWTAGRKGERRVNDDEAGDASCIHFAAGDDDSDGDDGKRRDDDSDND